MLRAIYRLLLLLRPEQWRGEMLATFDEASTAAWARGLGSYFAFALREMGGALRPGPAPARSSFKEVAKSTVTAFAGLIAGVGLAVLYLLVAPPMYTSRATIRTVEPQFPPGYTPTAVELSIDSLQLKFMPQLVSRNTLTNLIQTYNLYESQRRRFPMEDILEIMRKNIEIHALSRDLISIGFTYKDRYVAQKVARDLMSRVIDENLAMRSSSSRMLKSFLQEQVEDAARDWEALDERIASEGAKSERLMLDRQLARERYESIKRRVSEAETLDAVESRRQGPTLEVLDMPSLPEQARVAFGLRTASFVGLAGLTGAGVALAWLWIRRLRQTPVPLIARA